MEPITTNKGTVMGTVEIKELSLNDIKLSKNSRLIDHPEDMSSLMQSIKEVGLLQPIGVVKKPTGYEVCYGNRRYLACSKLGYSKIPVIVHTNKNEYDEDLKNLTENIQRRNISLIEAGRYIKLLQKHGLTREEIAVRLGVNAGYVKNCADAFERVPNKFKKNIEVVTKSGGSVSPGKISISVANKISNVVRKFKLDGEQEEILFESAKKRNGFNDNRLTEYARKVKSGSKDPVHEDIKTKRLQVNLLLAEPEFSRIYEKHIASGPYSSMTQVVKLILEGKLSERIKIIKTF